MAGLSLQSSHNGIRWIPFSLTHTDNLPFTREKFEQAFIENTALWHNHGRGKLHHCIHIPQQDMDLLYRSFIDQLRARILYTWQGRINYDEYKVLIPMKDKDRKKKGDYVFTNQGIALRTRANTKVKQTVYKWNDIPHVVDSSVEKWCDSCIYYMAGGYIKSLALRHK